MNEPYKPTQAQLMQDLLDGKKMRKCEWGNGDYYIYLNKTTGMIEDPNGGYDPSGNTIECFKTGTTGHTEWEEYKEPESGECHDEALETKNCENCRYEINDLHTYPCNCCNFTNSKWEPQENKPIIDWEPLTTKLEENALLQIGNIAANNQNAIEQIINHLNQKE